MFRKHAVQMRFVKDQPITETTTDHNPFESVEVAAAYAEIAKDVITHAAFTIGGVWAACKIIGRICK